MGAPILGSLSTLIIEMLELLNQDLIYAAPRKFRKPRDSDFKPTIVVSVADEQDRKKVKKRIKELKWLEKEIRYC